MKKRVYLIAAVVSGALAVSGCTTDPEYVARRSTAFHRGEQGIPVTCFIIRYELLTIKLQA